MEVVKIAFSADFGNEDSWLDNYQDLLEGSGMESPEDGDDLMDYYVSLLENEKKALISDLKGYFDKVEVDQDFYGIEQISGTVYISLDSDSLDMAMSFIDEGDYPNYFRLIDPNDGNFLNPISLEFSEEDVEAAKRLLKN